MNNDFEHTEHITCPYCKHKHIDSWDYTEPNRDYSNMHCDNCGKEFEYHIHIRTTYSTYKREEG